MGLLKKKNILDNIFCVPLLNWCLEISILIEILGCNSNTNNKYNLSVDGSPPLPLVLRSEV